MTPGEKFFVKIVVRAFGIEAEAAAAKVLAQKENDGEVQKGLFVDKEM